MKKIDLDEPSEGYDDPYRPAIDVKLFPLVQGMLNRGVTGVTISHALVEILHACCLNQYKQAEESRPWTREFLWICEQDFTQARASLQLFEERVAEAVRNIQAGGTGTHFQ